MIVRLAESARVDAREVAAHYGAERAALGDEFLDALANALDVIGANPAAWVVWPDIPQPEPEIRRYTMRRFPYSIGYQILADHVWVVVIAHGARKPGHWR